MVTAQNLNDQPPGPRRRRGPAAVVGGTALMLLGVALMGYGAHYLAKTGTCSGTGYVEYGPVPKCPGGEALYIMSAFFVGPLLAITGWLIARARGWLWPTFCVGIGVGLFTLGDEATVSPGAKAFAELCGVCLFGLAVVSVIVTMRKRSKRRTGWTAPVSM